MAIGTENYPNTAPTTTAYPHGGLKDDTGINDGTPINKLTNDDIHQTFRKVLSDANMSPNNTPDNFTNGYQYSSALDVLHKRATGVINTAIPLSIVNTNISKIINTQGAASSITHLLPSSNDLKNGDSFIFVNNSNFDISIAADFGGTGDLFVGGATVFLLPLLGDFAEFILDKTNKIWLPINSKATSFPGITPIAISSFLNSWTADTPTPKCLLTEDNFVSVSGIIKHTNPISNGQMATLPVNYRPNRAINVPCFIIDSGVNKTATLSISTGGIIELDLSFITGPSTCFVSLDSINFYKNW